MLGRSGGGGGGGGSGCRGEVEVLCMRRGETCREEKDDLSINDDFSIGRRKRPGLPGYRACAS